MTILFASTGTPPAQSVAAASAHLRTTKAHATAASVSEIAVTLSDSAQRQLARQGGQERVQPDADSPLPQPAPLYRPTQVQQVV